jgi:hypothetical protein
MLFMSFAIYRANKLANLEPLFQNGYQVLKIVAIDQGVDKDVYYVTFESKDGKIFKNRYVDNPEKYGPLDALIDATLGPDAIHVNLQNLVGHYVKVLVENVVVNGRRYTNLKRAYRAEDQDWADAQSHHEVASSEELDPLDDPASTDDVYGEDDLNFQEDDLD